MKKNNRRITPHARGQSVAPLALALVPFLLSPLAVHAQLAAAPAGPAIHAAGNGTPIVNIVAPNAAGVSHNRFTDYNVGTAGVILNNSNGAVQSRLGGMISGNPQLSGGAAKVIINEVIGTHASVLRGTTEVAGPSVRLVVANPNGIDLKGASFINVARATLTTGALAFDASGNLTRINTEKGTIKAQALDAADVDQVDLIAHAIDMNAFEKKTRQLNTVSGVSSMPVDLFKKGLQFSGMTMGTSSVHDASALGSMQRGGISIVGDHNNNVGVNVGGKDKELTGSPAVSAQGLVTVTPSRAQQPVVQPVVPPVAQQAVPPVAQPVVQQVIPPVVRPVAQQAVPPVALPVVQQVVPPVVQPVVQQVVPPLAQPVVRPVVRGAYQWAEQQREQAAQQRQQALQQAEQQRAQAAQQRQQALRQAEQQREQAAQQLQQALQQAEQQRAQAAQQLQQAEQLRQAALRTASLTSPYGGFAPSFAAPRTTFTGANLTMFSFGSVSPNVHWY